MPTKPIQNMKATKNKSDVTAMANNFGCRQNPALVSAWFGGVIGHRPVETAELAARDSILRLSRSSVVVSQHLANHRCWPAWLKSW